jgi:toxin ParE1/3/4
MIDLILLLQAESDIQSAFNRCEAIQEGRGELFLNRVDVVLGMLRRHPELGSVYAAPFRRILVRDFPYGIFYQVQPSRIIVNAVLDLRQDQERIRRKLL